MTDTLMNDTLMNDTLMNDTLMNPIHALPANSPNLFILISRGCRHLIGILHERKKVTTCCRHRYATTHRPNGSTTSSIPSRTRHIRRSCTMCASTAARVD